MPLSLATEAGWDGSTNTKRCTFAPISRTSKSFPEDKLYVQEGLGRMINLPLLVKGQCLGILNIGTRESGVPDPGDIEFLTQVGMQIAYAIDHVQAYEQINLLRNQLARENVYLNEEPGSQRTSINWLGIVPSSNCIDPRVRSCPDDDDRSP